MVKAEAARSETRYTTPENYTHKRPIITTDKPNNVLASRTLRYISYKLDPYKQNPTDSPITTLTYILECYNHTLNHKLQPLDFDHNVSHNHPEQFKQPSKI